MHNNAICLWLVSQINPIEFGFMQIIQRANKFFVIISTYNKGAKVLELSGSFIEKREE